MEGKGGYAKTILVVIIGILIVSIIGSIIYIYKTYEKDPISYVTQEVERFIQENFPEDDPIPEPPKYGPPAGQSSPGFSGGGGGGGGGDSSSTTSSSGGDGCIYEKLDYYMINFLENSECQKYEEGFCVQKLVECSIDVQNKDDDVGYFFVLLSFVEQGKDQSDSVDSIERSFALMPEDTEVFDGSTIVTSVGEDGAANKKINCYYNTLVKPYKEFC